MPWSVRPLAETDADEVAVVFAESRRAAMPWLPVLHTPDEDVAFFAAEVESSAGWGAVDGDGRLVGFALLRDGWLNHLYMAPDWRGRGVGSALLSRAVAEAASPVDLWTFARNEPALAFYARHGFEVVERTDGSANEEREPDVRMRHAPVVGIRLADGADAEALAGVHVRSWQAAYAGLVDEAHLGGLDVHDRARLWRDRLTDGGRGAVTYVATLGTEVVGFADVGPVRDEDLGRQQERWAEVYALYVDPARWRSGIGTALWGAVDAGWPEETVAVALWVLHDNVRARAFYAARGLAPDGAERSVLIGQRTLTEVRMVIWR
jgi:GNAT superfamily N-acetyltransferase